MTFWDPNKLLKQISASIDFPTAGLIYTDGWIFNGEDLNELTPYKTIAGKLIHFKEMYILEYDFNYIPNLAVLLKKSIIDKIGLQDEGRTFFGCEDWDYWLRTARAEADFYGIPEKLFFYRRHSNNTSSKYLNMLLAQTSVLIKNFDPNLIDRIKISNQLKTLIFPLINGLIKERRFEDINYILNGILNVLPSNSYKLIKIIIKLLGRQSFYPVAIIGKLERLLI